MEGRDGRVGGGRERNGVKGGTCRRLMLGVEPVRSSLMFPETGSYSRYACGIPRRLGRRKGAEGDGVKMAWIQTR
jgi:hypothetical protein